MTKLVRRGETLVSRTRQSKRRNNWAVCKQPRGTLMNHWSVTLPPFLGEESQVFEKRLTVVSHLVGCGCRGVVVVIVNAARYAVFGVLGVIFFSPAITCFGEVVGAVASVGAGADAGAGAGAGAGARLVEHKGFGATSPVVENARGRRTLTALFPAGSPRHVSPGSGGWCRLVARWLKGCGIWVYMGGVGGEEQTVGGWQLVVGGGVGGCWGFCCGLVFPLLVDDLVGGGAPAILTSLYKCPMSVRDYTPCYLMAFVVGGGTMRVPMPMLPTIVAGVEVHVIARHRVAGTG